MILVLILVVAFSQEVAAKHLLGRDESANVQDVEDTGQNRILRKLRNYTDPVWFDFYKGNSGKAFKRCKFQENTAPVDGSRCPKMKAISGDYNCAFGEQICPDELSYPKVTCRCDVSKGVWSCAEYKPCETTPPVTTCPKQHPITFNPPLTCVEGLICPIGKQKCCGTEFPAYICTCENGIFECDDDTSCSGACRSMLHSNVPVASWPFPPTPPTPTTPWNPCYDRSGTFDVGLGRKRNCAWVGELKGPRCIFHKDKCPVTCNYCPSPNQPTTAGCTDRTGTFPVDPGRRQKDCAWVGQLKRIRCVFHMDKCPVTCGKCQPTPTPPTPTVPPPTCSDRSGTFLVDPGRRQRDCAWVGELKGIRCVFHRDKCPATCGDC
ncbi:hypothetical protein MHU86_1896 [Fragilaria crotonensis]|nr:hypothetical protein MHU86_1896 [Fragilaria crotonensis]